VRRAAAAMGVAAALALGAMCPATASGLIRVAVVESAAQSS
jgi:hypothetical protein